MVGKGVEPKSSRIFHQCYLKCCKLQNLTPLNNVIPSGNGKVLDFCVDRVKYADWPPILNALSCDLSLHSVSIRCRQQVKTVLEHIDCERLAKTVNKRAVILTNFMLTNLVEASAQLLSNTTLLATLLLEGLPLKIPYLNPLCEALLANNSLQHLYLPRCLIGDAGCLAVCKAVRCLPNILTLDLSGCELTAQGAGYIADLIKVTQPIHRTQMMMQINSLKHLYLPRCLIGDAGCLAVCKAVRCLPNILTLDLSGCELTAQGAGYIADLVKYQKIHRYSENWIHTLRYRMPELDTMAGLRRITLCGNPQLGDAGAAKLFDVLADDLWIKAVDIQNCGLTEQSASIVLKMMASNTTLVILDMRHNVDICIETLSKLRGALRDNERGAGGQYSWLSNVSGCPSDGRSVKSVASKNGIIKDRIPSIGKNIPSKYVNKANIVKKEKDYAEVLEEQLQEEISHRQQLEELNLQLVDQMKQLKQQQIRLWANGAASSGSEQSLQASSRSCDMSSSSGSTSSVPIDQNTLSYIQQAFKDIYAFIKNNQCDGQCLHEAAKEKEKEIEQPQEETRDAAECEDYADPCGMRVKMFPKKAQSAHLQLAENGKMNNKMTKSAHLLGNTQRDRARDSVEMKPEMFERHMGDSINSHGDDQSITEDMVTAQVKLKKVKRSMEHNITQSSIFELTSSRSPRSGAVSDSSATLVCSPRRPTPRAALYSSDDDSA